MIARRATIHIQSLLRRNPAVVLVGPRQCGKTTLARALGDEYFDLESEADRARLDAEWDRIAAAPRRRMAVLDEAQNHPALFPRLRSAIDRRRRVNGRFLLLGSVSPGLMHSVSESLAGRAALCELGPLSAAELPARRRAGSWRLGGYPDGGVLGGARHPRWQLDYLALLAQRDFPTWGMPAKPAVTLRLLRMLAALHGQAWNASQVGASLGLSYHTVNAYLDFLEQTFLIRVLRPYATNIAKRLVKAPRVYWRDSGLLHALLGFAGGEQALLSQPWVGASWEGWIIEQLCLELGAAGAPFEPFYLRTSDGKEIDLLLSIGGALWAIEVKLTAVPDGAAIAALNAAADLVGARRRLLVCRARRPIRAREWLVTDLPGALRELRAR